MAAVVSLGEMAMARKRLSQDTPQQRFQASLKGCGKLTVSRCGSWRGHKQRVARAFQPRVGYVPMHD